MDTHEYTSYIYIYENVCQMAMRSDMIESVVDMQREKN